jgi:DNA invertase Pin-like site-specific DNA recombinase
MKPSSGLSEKQKSGIAKKASAGKDIGKPGKNFGKVAAKAAKTYGSKEAGERVAAAAMWKNTKRR